MDDGSLELASVNGKTVRPTREDQGAGTELTMVENEEILEICIVCGALRANSSRLGGDRTVSS
jgi:hypothetical protein